MAHLMPVIFFEYNFAVILFSSALKLRSGLGIGREDLSFFFSVFSYQRSPDFFHDCIQILTDILMTKQVLKIQKFLAYLEATNRVKVGVGVSLIQVRIISLFIFYVFISLSPLRRIITHITASSVLSTQRQLLALGMW